MIEYHIAEFGRVLVSKLPTCVSYSIAAGTGELIYGVWPRGRRNMILGISNILDDELDEFKVRKTARACMRNFCKFLIDILRYAHPKEDFFRRNFKVQGLENLDAALNKNKGVILVSFHLGNLDLGPRLLSSMGYSLSAVVHHLCSEGMDKFLQNARSRSGMRLIDANEPPSRFLEVLRRNEILALMIDSPNCSNGVKVKLGRTSVMMPSGAATLSLRTGAPIKPCGLVRSSNTTFTGIIGQPVQYKPIGKISEDIRELTQCTVSEIEIMIKPFMDQWYVFHPLFRDSPRKNHQSSGLDIVSYSVS